MEKYIVNVNGNFMVSVEAESALGAEHFILDRYADAANIYGAITGALAFGKGDMKTDSFLTLLLSSQTISIDELDEYVDRYINSRADLKKAEDDAKTAQLQLDILIAERDEIMNGYSKRIEKLFETVYGSETIIKDCQRSVISARKALAHNI